METLTAHQVRQFIDPRRRVGATYVPGDGVYIRLWAPTVEKALIEWTDSEPILLTRDDDGYHLGHFPAACPGDTYFFLCDGRRIPDPASRHQPTGVFGPSAVLPADYVWTDDGWRGVPYESWVIYEIHTGTFSGSHDFSGIIQDLERLKTLGVTTLEIMPVSPFSGARNWGYDGVFPHAVQAGYGGPAALKALVDSCHAHGLAVILDVVFNHLGPEGNVLFSCGPYMEEKYRTPWGDALNFDGPGSDHVRRYFLQAAWQWLTEYHFDGLRLDAVQTIIDTSPVPFLEDLARLKREAERVTGRRLILTAESDRNDSRLLQPVDGNGLGMDAQWADDLHHALHATLTGERSGYYMDYGGAAQIAKIYERGVAYEGGYSPFRRRRHGRSYEGIDRRRLIAETQNHDQTGNRLRGERLSVLVDLEKLKLAAACVMLSPFTPFIFMGEELAAENPFLYFVDHQNQELLEACRAGRRREWKSFGWTEEPPDPGAPATFERCVLRDKNPAPGSRAALMQSYYRELAGLSKTVRTCVPTVEYDEKHNHIALRYQKPGTEIAVFLSFNAQETAYGLPGGVPWRCALASAGYEPATAPRTPAALPPFSATVFSGEKRA
jgi:maltooligosyltrehalose trehalohydrolase